MSILANRLPVRKPRFRLNPKVAPRHGTCELFIKIHVAGHRTAGYYRLKPVPGAACRAWELQTPTGRRYHLCRDGSGHVTCDCPDFIFVRANTRNGCKHTAALTAAGLL
jgi:hypothetical protein